MWICKTVISAIIENDSTENIDWNLIKHVYYYQPGGTSTKNLIHWLQILNKPEVTQYDHGEDKNMIVYGQLDPPKYDLGKLEEFNIDMFITTSDGDPYCVNEDYKHMMEIFKKSNITVKNLSKYNHLDYLWSASAYKDIYRDLVIFFNK
jgi:hypothetical protein